MRTPATPAASPRGRVSVRTWVRDLAFGAQLAFRGARVRTALTAVGIGLAVAVLLFATALPHAVNAHQTRVERRTTTGQALGATLDDHRVPTRGLLAQSVNTTWQDAAISGMVVQALSADAPKVPGVPRTPGDGQTYVSPRLGQLLRDPANRLLAERIPGRVVGTVSDDVLGGPRDLVWYSGSAGLQAAATSTPDIFRVARFGSSGSPQLGPFLDLLILIGSVVLLFPIAILVATAARFGSARRDRRLAALRLMGTSRNETARIAAGEALAAALLGVGVGVALLLGARQLVERVHPFGLSLFEGDVAPSLPLVLLVVAAALVLAVGVTIGALRRVAIEPLAVTRRGGGTGRRRLWWRPLPIVAGVGLLLPLLGNAAVQTSEHGTRVGLGAVCMLLGIVLLLPWMVEALVRRGSGWSPSSQLALRTLQPEATSASRIVSGVAVAVAGAITLQMLLATAMESTHYATRAADSQADDVVTLVGSPARAGALRRMLASTKGVTAAHVFATLDMEAAAPSNGIGPVLAVAPCADLAELTTVTACEDGDVFRAVAPPTRFEDGGRARVEETKVPAAGAVARIFRDGNVAHPVRWRVPRGTPEVQARIARGVPQAGIYATPGAAVPVVGSRMTVSAYVHLDPDDPLAIERVRTAAIRFDPTAFELPNRTVDDHRVATVRRALLGGAALLLLLIAASLVVTTLEQLGERRRTLATLAAFGTPAKVLRRALWWQIAIPVVLGLVLAVAIGVPLGAILLRSQQEPFLLRVPDTLGLLALGGGMVVVVLACALPFLQKVAAPSALRTE